MTVIEKRTIKIKSWNTWFSQGVKRNISCGVRISLNFMFLVGELGLIFIDTFFFHTSFLCLGTVRPLHKRYHISFGSCWFVLLVNKPTCFLPQKKWRAMTMPSDGCPTVPGLPACLCVPLVLWAHPSPAWPPWWNVAMQLDVAPGCSGLLGAQIFLGSLTLWLLGPVVSGGRASTGASAWLTVT